MEKTKVAIVGLGTVGTGVARLLLEQAERVARHAGRRVELAAIVVRDKKKTREIPLPAGIVTDDLNQVIRDPEIRVVAQLIGGLEPERTIMLRLLESGKEIVTANKALLAEHGPELFDAARRLGRSIAFDASVGGGIPIVTNMAQCLSANQISSLQGILNGTTNFIVSKMEEEGVGYATALAEAQRLGYAEADPTLDVNGSDAAQKLAILAHLAFGARVHWSQIPRVGIDSLDPLDLRYAKELGYRVKLLAIAQLTEHGLELHVSPTLVRIGQPLAEVRSAYNAISVVGDAVGRVFFHGKGAGQMPTASAVVADLIDTCVGRTQLTFRTLDLWSSREARVELRQHAESLGRFYLRFTVEDSPGVLGQIASILGQHGISIASVIQHEPESESGISYARLVIMTHKATEGAAQRALARIGTLPSTRQPNSPQSSIRMRVLD